MWLKEYHSTLMQLHKIYGCYTSACLIHDLVMGFYEILQFPLRWMVYSLGGQIPNPEFIRSLCWDTYSNVVQRT